MLIAFAAFKYVDCVLNYESVSMIYRNKNEIGASKKSYAFHLTHIKPADSLCKAKENGK